MKREIQKLAALMGAAVAVLGLFTLCLMDDVGLLPGVNKTADEERKHLYEQEMLSITTEGEILDRNGAQITYVQQGSKSATVCSTAFSDPVGYNINNKNLFGLRERYKDVLFFGEKDGIGNAIQLNLDSALQQLCYDTLGKNEGNITVIDSTTGEILAMASRSSGKIEYNVNEINQVVSETTDENGKKVVKTNFDIYNQNEESDDFWLSRATNSEDPPGSVMKIVTAAALLRNGREDFTYDDDGTLETVGGAIVNYNKRAYGEAVDLQRALNNSINTYFAAAARELGKEKMVQTMKAFGLGMTIPCDWKDITSEFSFENVNERDELAWIGHGQGTLRVCPINVAMFMMPVLNEGCLMQPYLVRKIQRRESQPLEELQPIGSELFSRPLTPEQAQKLGDMLHITARDVYDFDEETYGRVYAKTGTADTHRGTNHVYFVCGMEDVGAGEEKRDVVIVVTHFNETGMSSVLKQDVKTIAKYLIEN